jgi:TonB family protein
MRAPLPFRKLEPIDQAPSGNPGQARVQIAAILDKEGRLEKIAILTRPATMTEQSVMQDLGEWEFKPATRDGVPVDVEVVIEIPFNLATAVARQVVP